MVFGFGWHVFPIKIVQYHTDSDRSRTRTEDEFHNIILRTTMTSNKDGNDNDIDDDGLIMMVGDSFNSGTTGALSAASTSTVAISVSFDAAPPFNSTEKRKSIDAESEEEGVLSGFIVPSLPPFISEEVVNPPAKKTKPGPPTKFTEWWDDILDLERRNLVDLQPKGKHPKMKLALVATEHIVCILCRDAPGNLMVLYP